ncbi:MAG: hypothetical protein HY710_02675 [Candidatus Latescibacteria bacterium]|nr:hypothetical protein [Candidatus Latescibacterota bacterium]
MSHTNSQGTLFPTDLPPLRWSEFPAAGFARPVSGIIYRTGQPPCCGVPLGGISTGCLDIDARGVYGFSSLFNPSFLHPVHQNWRITRKPPAPSPFLGLAVGDKTWVLAAQEMMTGGTIPWCTEPQMLEVQGKESKPLMAACPVVEGVQAAREIHYWGHYPVADMEFETDAPVGVGLRAWSPFLPGDTAASNIPAAVFEVHLRNATDQPQHGTIAFDFPGPDAQDARATEFIRQPVDEDVRGMLVSSTGGVNYILGVIGNEHVRFGAGLTTNPTAWSRIATDLPQPARREHQGLVLSHDFSCSVAVDFSLAAGQEKVVRFLLAWYAPVLEGAKKTWTGDDRLVIDGYLRQRWLTSAWAGDTNYYTQMYAARYDSALDVARRMAVEHETLLQRVLAWQAVVYTEDRLPVWLRDALVNNLCLIAEDSYWVQAKPPVGDWGYPEGVFALNESPRGCPHISCIPCDWYGNLPVVLFFPELALSNLKAFKQYQLEDGEIPFAIGRIGDLPDLTTPEYYWQVSLNGTCYIDMVDRLWQRTGDETVLRAFYDSVKRCNTFTMNLRTGPGGVISMPEIGGMEWFEFGEWAGMAAHMGGLRLAQLRMVERMAEAMGDAEYVERCRAWLADGCRAMEEEMWAGSYYLNFYEKETGKKSDDVMGYQLDGEWAARYHGLPGVFRADRVKTTLDTIKRCNIALTPDVGAANFVRPDGSPLPSGSQVAVYGQYAMFPPELVVLAMTYMVAGEREFGVDLCRRHWENLTVRQRHPWDLPNIVRGDTGARVFGTDYYQNMMLWAVPASIDNLDITTFCAPGSLVDRMIQAGKAE